MSFMPTNRPGQPKAYGSYGSFLGLPEGVKDRQTMLDHKRKTEMDEFMERTQDLSAGMNPADRATFQIFSKMGAAIGNKLAGPEELTPDEEQRLGVIETTNQRYRELADKDESFATLDPVQRSHEMRRIFTEELGNAGYTEEYLSQAEELFKSKQAYAQGQAQTKVLENSAEVSEAETPSKVAKANADAVRLREGQVVSVIKVEDGVPVVDGGVTSVRAFPDGTYRDPEGNVVELGRDFMLTDDAINVAKAVDTVGTKGVSPTNSAKFAKEIYTAKEREGMRQTVKDVDRMVTIVDTVDKAMTTASDPLQVVGNVGAMTQMANNAMQSLKGWGNAASGFLVDGKTVSPTDKEFIESFIPDTAVPEQFRADVSQAALYKSAIMQMVYADARMEEPGARQLSDADIQNAKDRLGVGSSDPLSVVTVFRNNAINRMGSVRNEFERHASIMTPAGGDAAVGHLVGRASPLAYFDEQLERIQGSFGHATDTVEAAGGEAAQGAQAPAGQVAPMSPEERALLDRVRGRNR